MLSAPLDVPCLENTGQGFSVLYKKRYLFSRHAPQRALGIFIENLTILPETLILCLSPVLAFPLELLQKKLILDDIKNCFILNIEKDPVLFEFFCKQVESGSKDNKQLDSKSDDALPPFSAVLLSNETDIALLLENNSANAQNYPCFGQKLPPLSSFRRTIVIEASASVRMYQEFYKKTAFYAQDAISRFWKNRMTLVQLGRLFSRNILKNAAVLNKARVLPQSASKPILIAGAGPSLNQLIPFIKKNVKKLYIIAVDSALRPFLDQGIRPSVLIALESQFVNQRALIGALASKIPIIADISSRPSILEITGGEISFFMSEYFKSPLLERVQMNFPNIRCIPPLGSVGLAATEIALMLRREGSPIFVCGLDFSYPPAQSHCKEAPSFKDSINNTNRLQPHGSSGGFWRQGSFAIRGKNGKTLISDPVLRSYAELFFARYAKIPQLYDISSEGAKLGIPLCSPEKAESLINASFAGKEKPEDPLQQTVFGAVQASLENISAFYKAEKEQLIYIRNILTGAQKSSEKELLALLEKCSYLYLHFPDAHKGASLKQDFLNRVRSEIDLFIKDIETRLF